MSIGFASPSVHDVHRVTARHYEFGNRGRRLASVDIAFRDRAGNEVSVNVYFAAGEVDRARALADAINAADRTATANTGPEAA